jgi:hypothetical protein
VLLRGRVDEPATIFAYLKILWTFAKFKKQPLNVAHGLILLLENFSAASAYPVAAAWRRSMNHYMTKTPANKFS